VTDEEKYIIWGRLRDQVREAAADVAALRESFQQYRELLQLLDSTVGQFLEKPSGRFPSGRLVIDTLNDYQRLLAAPGFFEKAAMFLDKSRRLDELRKRLEELDKL
jgi:hypothetical protein